MRVDQIPFLMEQKSGLGFNRLLANRPFARSLIGGRPPFGKQRGQIFRDFHRLQRWYVRASSIARRDVAHKRLYATHEQAGDLAKYFAPAFDTDTKLEHQPMYSAMLHSPGLAQNMCPFQMIPGRSKVVSAPLSPILFQLVLIVGPKAWGHFPVKFHEDCFSE